MHFLLVLKDLQLLRSFKHLLETYGAGTAPFRSIDEAMRAVQETKFNLVFSEWNEETAPLLESFRTMNPAGLFFAYMEKPSYEETRHAFAAGVDDVLTLPVSLDEMFATILRRLSATFSLPEIRDYDLKKIRELMVFGSESIMNILRHVPKISRTGHNLLITGETGTGKELMARAIHAVGSRSRHPFIAVNCGAIPTTLIESELFGHEKGSFTGAGNLRRGKFEMADTGTLFLDEIGDMPLNDQTKLLRAIEERRIQRIGSETQIPIDVRIISATRVNLEDAVQNRLFREDLYYRLNTLSIHMPSLRERKQDIPLLATHFLEAAFSEQERVRPYPPLSRRALGMLMDYDWPGNIRELRNVATRTAVMLDTDKKLIEPEDVLYNFNRYSGTNFGGANAAPVRVTSAHKKSLPEDDFISVASSASSENVIEVASRRAIETKTHGGEEAADDYSAVIVAGETMDDVKRKAIELALRKTRGDRKAAAGMLGIHPRTIARMFEASPNFANKENTSNNENDSSSQKDGFSQQE